VRHRCGHDEVVTDSCDVFTTVHPPATRELLMTTSAERKLIDRQGDQIGGLVVVARVEVALDLIQELSVSACSSNFLATSLSAGQDCVGARAGVVDAALAN
jgi:hypothetical protein